MSPLNVIVVCVPDTLRPTFGSHWSLYWMITPLGLSGGLHEITADVDVVKVTLSFSGALGSVKNLSLSLLQQNFLLSAEVTISSIFAGPSPTIVAALTEQV